MEYGKVLKYSVSFLANEVQKSDRIAKCSGEGRYLHKLATQYVKAWIRKTVLSSSSFFVFLDQFDGWKLLVQICWNNLCRRAVF
jgi:hypothetical protein